MMRWSGGARGTLVASQTLPGHANDLSVRIYGKKAGLEWHASRPEELRFTPLGGETRTLLRGGPGSGDASRNASRMPSGHPEGYIEALANLYRAFASSLRGLGEGALPLPGIDRGLSSLAFIEAVLESNRTRGWVAVKS